METNSSRVRLLGPHSREVPDKKMARPMYRRPDLGLDGGTDERRARARSLVTRKDAWKDFSPFRDRRRFGNRRLRRRGTSATSAFRNRFLRGPWKNLITEQRLAAARIGCE